MRFAKSSQDSFEKFERSSATALTNVAKSAGGAALAFLSVSSAIGQLTKSLSFADEINDVAKANEVAVGSVLKLAEALSLNGGEASSASKVFSALTQSIDSAAKGSEETQKRFASLGISLDDIRQLDGQQLFNKTLEGLNAISDPIERNAAAMDLLGKAVKGVDIAGLGNDYLNNQTNFDAAQESFTQIGDAMDRLDKLSFKTSQSLATNFGPVINTLTKYLDTLLFGVSNLEKKISQYNNTGATPFKSAPKITDSPSAGMFNLPKEFQAAVEVRKVIDKQAEKAKQDADRASSKAKDDAVRRYEALQKLKDDALEDELKRNDDLNKDATAKAKKIADYKMKLEMSLNEYIADIDEKQNRAQLNALVEKEQKEKDAIERLAQEQKRAADDINRSLTDALLRGFESGKGFAQNFRDTLKNLFQTLVLRPAIDFLVNTSGISKVLAGLGAAFTGTANASTGSSGGGGIFASLKTGFESLNTGFEKSITDLGTFLSSGNGGLADKLGGFIGANSSAIASVAPYLGSAFKLLSGDIKGAALSAGGTALGSLVGGPVGGVIGGALAGAIGGMFGGHVSRPKYYANSTVSSTGSKLMNAYGNSDAKGNGGGVAINGNNDLGSALQEYAKAFGGAISAFKLGSVFMQKYQAFWVTVGKDIGKSGSNYDVFFKSSDSAAGTAQTFLTAIKKGFIALPNDLAESVKRSVLSSASALSDIQALSTLKQMADGLSNLPPVFASINDAIKNTVTLSTVGDLQKRFQAITTFTELFYTQQENFATFTKQLTSQFTSLNQQLPATREGFRALVDGMSQDFSASGKAIFNGLVDLAPAADAYYKALQEQAGALNTATEANQKFIDSLNNVNNYADSTSYIRAQAYRANGTSLANLPINNNISTELVAEIRQLRLAAEKTAVISQDTKNLWVRLSRDGDSLLTEAI